ncbi:MAG: glycosyltransferase family 4 protein [Candidatus Magasanikbacteria bacterium]|nr:glycosyltransferase family 4 protein [Candidatus Magasanikbacteria bacterium]
MKIGIDARMYGPKQGGLGRYIEQLILHLEKLHTNVEFVIFLRRDNWNEYQPSRPNFRKVLADIPWYGLTEQIRLPVIIKKEKVDLMHFPHWNVPFFYSKPFVVTIHDLLLLHYPTRRASTLGPLLYWFKNCAFRIILNHAVKKAKHIFTVSEFSKQDIVRTLGVAEKKIAVTYPTPFENKKYKVENINYHNDTIPDTNYLLHDTFGITKPYVLYVGVAYPHKNLDGLLKAWKLFEEKYGTGYQLVLAGKKNYFYNRLTNNLTMKQFNNVIVTGFVPDADLPALYQGASLYIMPSFYEGFALPALEAMAAGVPVASSNRTCLPEILQNSALYFDPADAEGMANAIFTGLTDTSARQKLLAAAPAVLSLYQGEKLAQKTWEVYRNSV